MHAALVLMLMLRCVVLCCGFLACLAEPRRAPLTLTRVIRAAKRCSLRKTCCRPACAWRAAFAVNSASRSTSRTCGVLFFGVDEDCDAATVMARARHRVRPRDMRRSVMGSQALADADMIAAAEEEARRN